MDKRFNIHEWQAKQRMDEHHGDEDFPKLPKEVEKFLTRLKRANKKVYDQIEDIIRKHLEEMFDEIGRDDLSKNFSTEILIEPIVQKYVNSRRANIKPRFDKLTGRMLRRSIKP